MLIVDEIIDTGLTLSWLTSNLTSREPASVEICTLLRKPEALQMPVEVKYVGWDIPNEFVVGYGLDYRERYRNLRDIGTLAPHVYTLTASRRQSPSERRRVGANRPRSTPSRRSSSLSRSVPPGLPAPTRRTFRGDLRRLDVPSGRLRRLAG